VVLFIAADFAWICKRKVEAWDERYEMIRGRKYFGGFVYGLLVATVTILVRSSFRVAALTGEFHGKLWNIEVVVMVLDGAMVTIASFCLTVFHPGFAFHGRWGSVKSG
jgi:hypothetical protein